MKKILYSFLVIFLLLQFIPVNRENPPQRAEIKATEDIQNILKRSCYDCHSNQTVWHWYSYIFPISLFLSHHVNEGREQLNFSHWEELSLKKKSSKSFEMIESMESKDMPLPIYLWMHPNAKLSADEIEKLRNWADEIDTGYVNESK
jgi:hypothetical protein